MNDEDECRCDVCRSKREAKWQEVLDEHIRKIVREELEQWEKQLEGQLRRNVRKDL